MDESSAPWRALETPVPAGGPLDESRRGGAVDRRIVSTAAILGVAGILVALALWLVIGGSRGSVVVDGERARPSAQVSVAGADASRGPGAESLVVDVQGAVVHPGVVWLPPGSRVGDAIAGAGGFGPRVASDRVGTALNLAALVRDGDQIVVPSRDDPVAGAGGGVGSRPADGGGELVDLNHATAAELDALPGIGPATAAKVIAAREEQPFATVEDLRTRKVVGPATFDKLKDLVTVR